MQRARLGINWIGGQTLDDLLVQVIESAGVNPAIVTLVRPQHISEVGRCRGIFGFAVPLGRGQRIALGFCCSLRQGRFELRLQPLTLLLVFIDVHSISGAGAG